MSTYPPNGGVPTAGSSVPDTPTPVFDETRAETSRTEIDDAPLYSTSAGADASTESDASTTGGVGSTAKDAGREAAASTKDQAKRVASEAKSQASELLHTSTAELREQAGKQQERVSQGLRSLSEQLDQMAASSDNPGVAQEIVASLSARSGSVASWLGERDPGSLLGEVKSFAARRPGAFIAIAAGAGIVAGRLAKSLTASAKDEAAEGRAGL